MGIFKDDGEESKDIPTVENYLDSIMEQKGAPHRDSFIITEQDITSYKLDVDDKIATF